MCVHPPNPKPKLVLTGLALESEKCVYNWTIVWVLFLAIVSPPCASLDLGGTRRVPAELAWVAQGGAPAELAW